MLCHVPVLVIVTRIDFLRAICLVALIRRMHFSIVNMCFSKSADLAHIAKSITNCNSKDTEGSLSEHNIEKSFLVKLQISETFFLRC